MNHADVSRSMPDYLEGDLSLARRALFDAHLDECETCRREIAQMRFAITAIRTLPDPEPPLHLVDEAMTRIRAADHRETALDRLRDLLSRLLEPRVLAPVSAALLVAGVLLGTRPLREGLAPDLLAPVQPNTAAVAGRTLSAPDGGGRVVRNDRAPTPAHGRVPVPFDAFTNYVTVPPENLPITSLQVGTQRTSPSEQPGPYRRSPESASSIDVGDLATHHFPSAEQWLDHLLLRPVDFADQLAARTLAEREHWIESLARRASEEGRLERVVSALRASGSPTARALADEFASAGVRHGGTLSASAVEE